MGGWERKRSAKEMKEIERISARSHSNSLGVGLAFFILFRR